MLKPRETGFPIIGHQYVFTTPKGHVSPSVMHVRTSVTSTQSSVSSTSTATAQTSVTPTLLTYISTTNFLSNNLHPNPKNVGELEQTDLMKTKQPMEEKERNNDEEWISHLTSYTKVSGERLYLYSSFSISLDEYNNNNISVLKTKKTKGKHVYLWKPYTFHCLFYWTKRVNTNQ